jgi:hypothetical protein
LSTDRVALCTLQVRFLELLTGIPELAPDPAFFGSGVHLTAPGGVLAVHADFNNLNVTSVHTVHAPPLHSVHASG